MLAEVLYHGFLLFTVLNIIYTGKSEGFCNLRPKNVDVARSANKQGFHRDLITTIGIEFDKDSECSVCFLLLVEVIPTGMYVDLHEIKSAESFGGPKVLSSDDIDVEKPEYLSPEHTILIYIPNPLQVADTKHHSVHVELPVHLRYHRPSNDTEITSAIVMLQHPNVMIRCQGPTSGSNLTTVDLYQAPCDCQNTSMCAWQDLNYQMDNGQPLQFHVTIGQQSHTLFVCILTVTATVIGVLVLLRSMYSTQKHKVT